MMDGERAQQRGKLRTAGERMQAQSGLVMLKRRVQVAAQPVLMFPVLQPDGSIAAAVPLKPTTAQDEEEERFLDRHPLAGAALAGPARMHAMLHHMNQLTMS